MSYIICVLLIINNYTTTSIAFQKYNNHIIRKDNNISKNKLYVLSTRIISNITYPIWIFVIMFGGKYFLDAKKDKLSLPQRIHKNTDKDFYFLSALNGLLNTAHQQEQNTNHNLSEIIYTIAKKDENYIPHLQLLFHQICNIVILNKKLQYTKNINEYMAIINFLKIFLENLNILFIKYKDINDNIIFHYLQFIKNSFFYNIYVKIIDLYVLLYPNIIQALNNLILRKENIYFKNRELLFLYISTNENNENKENKIKNKNIERIISYSNECKSIIGIFDVQFIDEIITHFTHLYQKKSANIIYRYTFIKYFLRSNFHVFKDIFITFLIFINELNVNTLSIIPPLMINNIIKNIFSINIFALFYKPYNISYFYPVISSTSSTYMSRKLENIKNFFCYIFVKFITEYLRGILNSILYACENFAAFSRENNTTYIFRYCQNILSHPIMLHISIYIEFFWLFICLMTFFSLLNKLLVVEIQHFIPFSGIFAIFSFLYIPIFIITMLVRSYIIKYNIYIIVIGGMLFSYLLISAYSHIFIFVIICNLIYSFVKFYKMLCVLKMNNVHSLWNGSILSFFVCILYVIINNNFKLKVFFILQKINSFRRK